MSTLAIILLSLVIIFVILHFFVVNKNTAFSKKLTGPALPLLSNSFDFNLTRKILPTLTKYTKKYGEIVKIHIGPTQKLILVTDYKLLENIFTNRSFSKKSSNYRYFLPWLGTGLLTSNGQKWKQHRRILTPAFHFQILEKFIGVFESCGDRLVQKLQDKVNKTSTDVYPYVTLCTLDVICESVMGISINAQDNDNSEYVCCVKTICKIITERTISPIGMYDLLYPLTKNYYMEKKVVDVLHKQTNDVITKRRRELEEKKKANNDLEISATKNKKLFLDLLLEATVDGRKLSQEEIREEVDTFMFEGHDTTASAISFSIFCLANHLDVQKQAFDEQQNIFGNNKNPIITYTDLQNMKYLEQVIKETLRLYPSVPLFGRQTSEDIKYGNLVLHKGENLIIFPYGVHRNPKYFKDPEKFDPSRFDNFNGKLPYAYIPFSAGSRNCIGQKFAMLEMKSIISRIIRTFELQPSFPQHKCRLAVETVLKSDNGIKISLKPRE